MVSPVLNSSIDVLTWFLLKSHSSVENASQKKMHALLYVAQCYYAVLSDGDKLMPSVFIAKNNGVFEPNLLRVCKYLNCPPTIYEIPKQITVFLESIWSRYCEMPEDDMIRTIKTEKPYKSAIEKGEGSEILFSDMFQFYKDTTKIKPVLKVKEESLAKEKKSVIMKNEKGKAVKVSSWMPKKIGSKNG